MTGAVKVSLLSFLNALVVWSATSLLISGTLPGLGITLLVLLLIVDYTVMSPRAYPYRYMLPALALLLILVVYPIYFTVKTAFTNFGTGHMMTRREALEYLLTDPSYTYTLESSPTWRYSVYKNGEDFLIVFESRSGIFFSEKPHPAVKRGIEVLLWKGKLKPAKDLVFIPSVEDPRYVSTGGVMYKKFYDPDDEVTLRNEPEFKSVICQEYLFRAEFETPEGRIALRMAGDGKWRFFRIERLYRLSEIEEYGRKKTVLVNNITGRPLIEEDGAFYDVVDGERRFVVGYIDYVGLRNFTRILKDPNVSGPFMEIFAWTFVWASLSVLFTFAVGLSFALVLNDKRLRGRTLYRTLLIIPWAVPAFISVLVWKNGMFNETYGVINRFLLEKFLGLEGIKWFNDPFWAKVAVLTVNTWLGFPYMMTVSLGALQSIPDELYEASQIDGANRWNRFWKITFPLLLTTVAPLLVGSFAFNFNNFVNIYLLTGGGPPIPGTTTPAGSTDILISYTYKLAFEGGRGQDFGFASAVSIIIFFLVGGISFLNFKISGTFEESE